MNWYIIVLKKYAVFKGRASREEFWMFILFNFIISVVLSFVEVALGGVGIVGAIYSLAVFLPGIGVSIRRLHDTNRSGWWLLTWLIPLIGLIIMIIFTTQDSQMDKNRFGLNPKGF